jgi:hypothetical protein
VDNTVEISLFLYQSEMDLLDLLPGDYVNLVQQAIEFYVKNTDAMPGTFGGPMPRNYPLYVSIDKSLMDRLQQTGRAAEYAVRCWLNAIPGDYLAKRKALAAVKTKGTAKKAQGGEATP